MSGYQSDAYYQISGAVQRTWVPPPWGCGDPAATTDLLGAPMHGGGQALVVGEDAAAVVDDVDGEFVADGDLDHQP
jgi:hypothetical protein